MDMQPILSDDICIPRNNYSALRIKLQEQWGTGVTLQNPKSRLMMAVANVKGLLVTAT